MGTKLNYLMELGDEVEFNANKVLKDEFDDVIWVSRENHLSPYDFVCIKNNKKIKVDVKSCLHKIIYISKKKIEKIRNGEFGEFYFMLRVDLLTFKLMHWKEVIDGNQYKIMTNKLHYKKEFDKLFYKNVYEKRKKKYENCKIYNVFFNEKHEAKIDTLKKKWNKNKHETILKIIEDFKEK